ncbi:MAG: hypothetical protein AAGH15_10205, partial [Myxococcota bacterium]
LAPTPAATPRVPRPRAWIEVTPPPDPNALPPPMDYRESAKAPVDDLVLTRRWFGAHILFLALFTVFWCGFLVVWYGSALTQEDTPLMMVLFPLGHVAVGVGLAYYVLASFVNRTTVHATERSLTITKGPLPWPGNQTVDVAGLRRFYGATTSTKVNGRRLAQLSADIGGTKRKILKGIRSLDEAEWLAQRLAEHYGVPHEG